MKVALFLEESGLAYEPFSGRYPQGAAVRTGLHERVNPSAKVPAVIDGDVTVFDSNAILLYLGEKTGHFQLPESWRSARQPG
jgi:GSH-dependent disulfide-bond oxidoreductase